MSCGSSDNKNINLPDPPNNISYQGFGLVDGPLSSYLEVVPGSYSLDLVKSEDSYLPGYREKSKVKFKFIKSVDIKAGTGYNQYGPSIIGQVLNNQGIPLDFKLSKHADADLANYLKRGSGEEWLTFNVNGQGLIHSHDDAVRVLKMYKNGEKIRFTSEIIEEKFGNESTSTSSSTSSSTLKSTSDDISIGNCEEFLNGYEEFMNEYINIMKKMKKNPEDLTIISEYTQMMTKATEWAEKTQDCSIDAKFTARYTEIQLKIANALAE